MNSARCSCLAETLTAIERGGSRGHSELHAGRPGAGLAEDQPPDGDDQTGFLEQRHELGRRLEVSSLGVLPARQRLHARHVAALEVHDRLVAQGELARASSARCSSALSSMRAIARAWISELNSW